ncbi:ABC transporter ATP-binding protein [Motiliproteus sp. MSK22-1]|uniref:ABC transporter ATP-binding protein n=1 Tax=Motiliproteus sp. MSK22-1 TaxID=1897630 RepID=UPI00097667CB|nr:ABC transporter ATP-binding protein [Motiliproteus sp. MSK22-1]OMH30301.1 ABC transporter ATP-binding protein [Motiliproteus sp. MSK22-1]
MSEVILRTEGLCKHFGGLQATHEVSLSFERGVTHGILGPNGAGKTTLINLLSGELAPSSGKIFFKDYDITQATSDKVSRIGIGRSFQKTNIFADFTCFQNCWVGAQSRLSSSMRFIRPARHLREVHRRTDRALQLCGLAERRNIQASSMSYGEQRQLEIGMMLATEPELLLLDEPLAGMGSEESLKITELLKELAKEHTLILIEHDMDAVFAVADRLTVMVNGAELETGDVAQIRNSTAVQEAYLGSSEDAA